MIRGVRLWTGSTYVLQDPNTGDILAMSCMIRNADGSISASPTSIYTDAYAPGSRRQGGDGLYGTGSGRNSAGREDSGQLY